MAIPFNKQYESPAYLAQLLQSRGLQMDSLSKAETCLKRYGYYRLSAYWHPLLQMPKTAHVFKPGAHYDKLGHDHRVDLLFYNRDLRRTVVFELKKGNFKVAYLAQLSSYLRILNDDDRREGENAPVGIILCKNMDKEYVNYIMQDFLQPMGVATYKTADEVEPDVLKLLPPKEELMKLIEEQEK